MLPVRIAVVTDDRLFREGLLRIIGAEPSFLAAGHEEGAGLWPATARAHVLVVDSRTPGALSLCSARRRDGGPAVILVAAPDDESWALESLRAGARGILPKSARAEDLVKALRVVHEGQIWAGRQVMARWIERLAGEHPPNPSPARPPDESTLEQGLSHREKEVFRHAATGLGNKELADRLAISEATVKVHLTHIFQKLGLRGRTELAAAYHGLFAAAQDLPRRVASVPRPGGLGLPQAILPSGTVVRLKA